MKQFIVSFFQAPVSNKKPYGVFSLADIFRYITADPSLKRVTEEVRKEFGQKEVYKKKKLSLLPYVSPGGVFSRCCSSGFICPSGVFVVDIDGLASQEEACKLRDALAQDHLLQPDLVFLSPSARGVKLFVPYRIDPSIPLEECFHNAIEAAWTYIEMNYEVEVDRANTDLCRGCLLCHDADAKCYNKLLTINNISTYGR